MIQRRNFCAISVNVFDNRKGQARFSTSEAAADHLLDGDLLRIYDYFELYVKRLFVKLFDLKERKDFRVEKSTIISVNSVISVKLMKTWLGGNTEFGQIPKPID